MPARLGDPVTAPGQQPAPACTTAAALRFTPQGANPSAALVGQNPLTGTVSYLLGHDQQAWRTAISTYGQVAYPALYPGIDLVYYGHGSSLESDYVVAPGADPSLIAFSVDGAQSLALDGSGALVAQTAVGPVTMSKPVLYQMVNKQRQPVSGAYALRGGASVGFSVGAYNPGSSLTIDPVYTYGTYLGGGGTDVGYGVAVDSLGNAYVTGATASTTFPTTTGTLQLANAGGYDAFVTKVNALGTARVYSTYLGGSGNDYGRGIAVDSVGRAFVTGIISSTNFPTTTTAYASTSGGGLIDAFVAELTVTGTALLYSSYLGGPGADGGYGIAVDSAGNAYVTGATTSTGGFPISTTLQTANAGGYDAFVVKINPTLSGAASLVYGAYLGGNYDDLGYGIAVDALGSAYVTGAISSTTFPTTTSAYSTTYGGGTGDAFLSKLDPSGASLLYSTYLGGSDVDAGYGVAVDALGAAYVTGVTRSPDYPVQNAVQPRNAGGYDAFVIRINPALSGAGSLVYSTYLGGSGGEVGYDIAVDSAGNASVTGAVTSTDFPTYAALQATKGGGTYDAFAATLNAQGNGWLSSTYLGGSGDDLGYGITVSAQGALYLTVATTSPNYPLQGALQSTNNGAEDAFLTKLTMAMTWLPLAPVPTTRTQVAAATGPDNQIYVFGGSTGSALATVEAFSPLGSSWQTISSMSTARAGLAAATGQDGRLYALGGSNGSMVLNTAEAYSVATHTWSTLPALPTARTGLAVVCGPDGRIYALGGETASGTALGIVEAYTPGTNSWATLAPLSTPRWGLAGAVGADGRLYVLGGSNGSTVFNTVEAYTPGTNSWTTVATLPTARTGLAAAPGSDGRLYALGGSDSSTTARATVEAYTPGTNTWQSVAGLGAARTGLAAVAGPDNRLYAVGGTSSSPSVSTVEAYGPNISLSSSGASPGDSVTLTGGDFPAVIRGNFAPNSTVSVYWGTPLTGTLVATTTTDAVGNMASPITVTVPATAPVGSSTLVTAVDDQSLFAVTTPLLTAATHEAHLNSEVAQYLHATAAGTHVQLYNSPVGAPAFTPGWQLRDTTLVTTTGSLTVTVTRVPFTVGIATNSGSSPHALLTSRSSSQYAGCMGYDSRRGRKREERRAR